MKKNFQIKRDEEMAEIIEKVKEYNNSLWPYYEDSEKKRELFLTAAQRTMIYVDVWKMMMEIHGRRYDHRTRGYLPKRVTVDIVQFMEILSKYLNKIS